MRTMVCALGIFVLTACGDDGPTLSDEELADAIHECRSNTQQSPSFAIRCDNYQRQCDKLRKEGRYVC